MKFQALQGASLVLLSLPLHTFAAPAALSQSQSVSQFARSILEKRANNPIVGLTDGVNGQQRPVRLELNSFVNNADQLSLYLLALSALGKRSYSDPNSYYAISGIHGRPYIGWNGETATGTPNTGYCTHSSILFPTWHRPYLALYEQAIHAQMQTLVSQFPAAQQSRWQNAVNGFRIPYWDWATNNAQMPAILTTPTVTVTQTTGQQQTINNPLFSYNFPSLSRSDFPDSPFYVWKNTLRYPTSQTSTATSQNTKVNSQLRNNAASQKQRVYNLLVSSTYNNYAAISNKASNTNAPDSLEAVHDVIHGLTGNGGHMSYVDYSAFDPIFYLHHANIDRLFAMWQALYPNAWITQGQNNPYGTYGVPPNTIEVATTPLTPFRNAAGAFHTSNSARSTASFGYSYPEIPDWNYQNNPAGLTQYVAGKVQSLYGSTTTQVQQSGTAKRDTSSDNSTATAIDNSVNDGKYYDWRVDVHANKMVLGGSYFVHVFLGQPAADPASWSSQPELVGDYVVFTNKSPSKPDAGNVCKKKDNLVSGSVFLTQALLNQIAAVGSLNPDDVVKYVKKNIQWRISDMNDVPIDVSSVCDLKISVSAAQVTLPSGGAILPTYGDYVKYTKITQGKPAGANTTDAAI